MRTVFLRSGGPWYDPVIKAHCLLGRRACREGLMSYQTVKAQIESNLSPYLEKTNRQGTPSLEMIRRWEKQWPDYPEWALRNGMVTESDLLPWGKGQVNRNIHMSQSRRVPSFLVEGFRSLPTQEYSPVLTQPRRLSGATENVSEPGQSSWTNLFVVLGLAWVAGKLVRAGQEASSQTGLAYQPHVRAGGRRRFSCRR